MNKPTTSLILTKKYRWCYGTATILTENGPMETTAFRTCMIPYITITEAAPGLWSITHDPSGMAISYGEFELIENAIEAAEDHMSGYDWFSVKPNPDGLPPSDPKLRKIIKEMKFAAGDEAYLLDDAFDR